MDDYLGPVFSSVDVALVDNDDEYLPAQQELCTHNTSSHAKLAIDQFALTTTQDGLRALGLLAAAGPAHPLGAPPLYVFMSLQI